MNFPRVVDTLSIMSRPKLALASSNCGKIAEFQTLLGNQALICSLTELGLVSPEETGTSFEENAVLKARRIHESTGLVTLADDSGLEVNALQGLPGVRSARFAGEQHSDEDNRALLLSRLGNIPERLRTARFIAVIAVMDASGNLTLSRGTCEGTIAFAERGSNGFGYDSIFQLPDGRTMAELDAQEKNAISHRGQAVRDCLPVLREALGLAEGDLNESASSS